MPTGDRAGPIETIAFRPLARTDFGDLAGWLADPEVHRWWQEDGSTGTLEATYGPRIDGRDPTEVFVVDVDSRASGIIQRYRTADDPAWLETIRQAVPALAEAPTAGIDYLLGRPDVRGRGIGTRVVDGFTRRLFAEMADVSSVVVAVQQANRASWRALERTGYHRVWTGTLASDDPSDAGPAYLLVRERAADPAVTAPPGPTRGPARSSG